MGSCNDFIYDNDEIVHGDNSISVELLSLSQRLEHRLSI